MYHITIEELACAMINCNVDIMTPIQFITLGLQSSTGQLSMEFTLN